MASPFTQGSVLFTSYDMARKTLLGYYRLGEGEYASTRVHRRRVKAAKVAAAVIDRPCNFPSGSA